MPAVNHHPECTKQPLPNWTYKSREKFKNFTALDGSLIYHGKRIDVIFP